ncbi:MAG: [FeFe] hydrogenase H-cluster radical SAM maturase HydE [Spirochaetota bacterium]
MLWKVTEKDQLVKMLSVSSNEKQNSLAKEADSVRKRFVGDKIYFRGIIEFSNICEKDCLYCGIRKSNSNVTRFMMTEQDIMKCARWAFANGYGSIVLQSGESTSPAFLDFLIKVVQDIKKETGRTDPRGNGLGITLCVGEQKKKTYEEFFQAGAHRYLLRIETSNPELYKQLHPPECSFGNRVRCLEHLREIGYQVGTGVMIGLPGQTIEDLVDDIFFYKDIDADMIGMGPYIPHAETPLSVYAGKWNARRDELLRLSLRMVAATRLLLKDVNIAATTAMQVLHPRGREIAFEYGANIIMPILTPTRFRKDYSLYDGKPCIDENAKQCKECIAERIRSIGRNVGWNDFGDSPHFHTRVGK